MSAAVKHHPATPLPWEAYRTKTPMRNAIMQSGTCFAEVLGPDYRRDPDDAAYIAHAANAYPRLVAALKHAEAALRFQLLGMDAQKTADNFKGEETAHANAQALLRELGEA